MSQDIGPATPAGTPTEPSPAVVSTPEVWQVRVTVPFHIGPELHQSLFDAIAGAVAAWEPADRQGWDPSVEGSHTPDLIGYHAEALGVEL